MVAPRRDPGVSRVLRLHVRGWEAAAVKEGQVSPKILSRRIQGIADILQAKKRQRLDVEAIRGLDRHSGKIWRPDRTIERGDVKVRVTLQSESWGVLEHFTRLVAQSISAFISDMLVHYDRIRGQAMLANDEEAGYTDDDWTASDRPGGVVFADQRHGDIYDPDADLVDDDDDGDRGRVL